MAYKSDILLGRITKLSGYEGAVAVKLEKIFSENIPKMESVYLEIEGRLVPFFISDLEYSGADILKLKFESYNTIEKVNEFIGARVFLTTIVPVQDESVNFQNFHGFQVFNQDNVLVGEIADVIPNPGQLLLSVNSGENKEILIPFHEDFILNVNKRKKIIVMNLPEGLIDINL
jgi:16S rRNA processing protein RimM